jgi:hypothetical protein
VAKGGHKKNDIIRILRKFSVKVETTLLVKGVYREGLTRMQQFMAGDRHSLHHPLGVVPTQIFHFTVQHLHLPFTSALIA